MVVVLEITRIKKIENKIEYKKSKKLKVAAYVRVSTSSDNQINSFESQKIYYENKIKR